VPSLHVASARAQPPPVRLEYARGAGAEHCPEDAAVRSAVVARLGYDPFRDDAQRTVAAAIEGNKQRLRADVNLRDAAGAVTGTRRLVSDKNDCIELAAAMTLAISIAIDPQSLTRPAPPPPPPTPPAPPTPAPAATPAPGSTPPAAPTTTSPGATAAPSPFGAMPGSGAPPGPAAAAPGTPTPAPPGAPTGSPVPSRRVASARPPGQASPEAAGEPRTPRSDAREVDRSGEPDRGARAILGAGGVAALGNAPGVALGLTVYGGAMWRSLSATIEGRIDLPSYEDAPDGGKVNASLIAASIAPCVHFLPPLFGCAVATIGSLRGEGEGVDRALSDSSLYASAGLRAGAAFEIERPLLLRITAEGGGVLTPTELLLNGSEVWSSPAVYGALGVAAEVRLP
jgi:hypothetical protein